jgi:hypothetical protein
MKKIILRGLGILLACVALLFVIFIAINWGDEPLRPEVEAAMHWELPANTFDDNGYLILLGMNAPDDQDAAQAGRKKLESELARYQQFLQTHKSPELSIPNSTSAIDWKGLRCDYKKEQNCVEFYLGQDPNKQAVLRASQQLLLARFKAIRQSKNYTNVMLPFITAEMPGYSVLINATELEHIQSITEISHGKVLEGVRRFVENAMFARRLLKESSSLVSYMIAISMVQRDMRILSELIKKYPEVASHKDILQPVLASLSANDYAIRNAFMHERAMVLLFMNSLKYEGGNAQVAEENALINHLATLTLQANSTTNLYYDWWDTMLKAAEAPAPQFDDALVRARREKVEHLGVGIDPYYFKNPVGKILVRVSDPEYEKYIERKFDTDGYVRLVALQLKIVSGHIPTTDVPDLLNRSDPAWVDPYTLKPMAWDEATCEIFFQGRQPSSRMWNGDSRYRVGIK